MPASIACNIIPRIACNITGVILKAIAADVDILGRYPTKEKLVQQSLQLIEFPNGMSVKPVKLT